MLQRLDQIRHLGYAGWRSARFGNVGGTDGDPRRSPSICKKIGPSGVNALVRPVTGLRTLPPNRLPWADGPALKSDLRAILDHLCKPLRC